MAKHEKCDKCGIELGDDEVCRNKYCVLFGFSGKLIATVIDVEFRNIKTTEKIEQPLLWYDPQTKMMKEMKGGKLKFTYDYDNLKMVINVGSNRAEIEDWMAQFKLKASDDNGKKIVVWYPKRHQAKIEDSLEDVKFTYKFLDSQLVIEPEPLVYTRNSVVNNVDNIIKWIEDRSEQYKLEIIIANPEVVAVRYPANFKDNVEESLDDVGLRYGQLYA